jgi:pseudouridylate synthase
MTVRSSFITLDPAVAEALDAGLPIVALESTIIAHGMPYPDNLETALRVERAVRDAGAVPATIAVLDGRLRVGLDHDEIERLATDSSIGKASVRELPGLIARGASGATTVAATMRIASLAGIRLFATGGIGGAHRGSAETFDISADLTELSRTPVAVVSAGAKAILDLAKTLEVLETLSVLVVGYCCDDFPAFYSRTSGLPVPERADTAGEIAAMLRAKWEMADEGGVLVASPIPVEFEIPAARIEGAIDRALAEANASGVVGAAVTPFLLSRLAEITGGESQRANVALVLSNAALAAQVACAYQATSAR